MAKYTANFTEHGKIYFISISLSYLFYIYIDAKVNKKIIKQMEEALEQDDSPQGKLWSDF